MVSIRPADPEREHEDPVQSSSFVGLPNRTGWVEFDDLDLWAEFPKGSRHVYRFIGVECMVEVTRRRRNAEAGTFRAWFREVEEVGA